MNKLRNYGFFMLLLLGFEAKLYPMFRRAVTACAVPYMKSRIENNKSNFNSDTAQPVAPQKQMRTFDISDANFFFTCNPPCSFNHALLTATSYLYLSILKYIEDIKEDGKKQIEDIKNNQKKLVEDASLIDKNTEIYAVFERIKTDFGITEEVALYEGSLKSAEGHYTSALYLPTQTAIIINRAHLQNMQNKREKTRLIQTIAHELEHHRQHNNYFGSYHGSDQCATEHGAEAAAAGYVDCAECLEFLQQRELSRPIIQTEGITGKDGYFTVLDYASYVQRACQEGTLCKAHANYREKWIDQIVVMVDGQQALYNHDAPTLCDFLPSA